MSPSLSPGDPHPSQIHPPEHELYGDAGRPWTPGRWSGIRRRLEGARYYWIAAGTPGGIVRAAPIWGVWHSDQLYAAIGLSTLIGRAVVAAEHATIHLESARRVIIVEGPIRRIDASVVPAAVNDRFEAKYDDRIEPNDPWLEVIPWFRLTPTVARAWSSSDIRATGARWTFPEAKRLLGHGSDRRQPSATGASRTARTCGLLAAGEIGSAIRGDWGTPDQAVATGVQGICSWSSANGSLLDLYVTPAEQYDPAGWGADEAIDGLGEQAYRTTKGWDRRIGFVSGGLAVMLVIDYPKVDPAGFLELARLIEQRLG